MQMYMLHIERDKENIATKRKIYTERYKFFNGITGQENTISDDHLAGACGQVYIVGKSTEQY